MNTLTSRFIEIFDSAQSNGRAMEAILDLSRSLDISVPALLDRLSLEVAVEYAAGILSYEMADQIMNAVYVAMMTPEFLAVHQMPELTLEVFEAFDSGEYIHRGDESREDPVEKHTKTKIAALLSRHE
jgi:hypothetical protein